MVKFNEQRIREARWRCKKAKEILDLLTKGRPLTMSIPLQQDDGDVVIDKIITNDLPDALDDLDEARRALGHIAEYWNGNVNQRAMEDALREIVKTAQAALGEEDGNE